MISNVHRIDGRSSVFMLVLLQTVLGMASSSARQNSGGTIQGTIQDDTGAVLPERHPYPGSVLLRGVLAADPDSVSTVPAGARSRARP